MRYLNAINLMVRRRSRKKEAVKGAVFITALIFMIGVVFLIGMYQEPYTLDMDRNAVQICLESPSSARCLGQALTP